MSFGGTRKALVVLVRDATVELLSWQQHRLTSIALLEHDEEGQTIFRGLVRQYPGFPVIVVADLLDENFRHDTIVHVSGSDHAALMKRKLDFSFRGTRYRRGVVTSRMSEGRKDDRIMLCALTKPGVVDLWANLLLEEERAIQSVTSIAHLLNHYVALEGLENEDYLLLSKLDSDRFLRQTFIRKGKVMFSRQASLGNVPERRLGVEILQESVQLRQYLERIHFIPYEKRLNVQILAGASDETIQVGSFSNESHHFEVVDINDQEATARVEVDDDALEPAHYLLARVLAHKNVDNVYAPPALTRYSDLRSLGKLLMTTAAGILLLGLGLNVPGLMSLAEMREQASIFQARIAPLQRQYQALSERFPDTPIPAQAMQLLVNTHEALRLQDFNPIEALNLVSAALARSPGLELTDIQWQLREAPFVPTVDALGYETPPPEPLPGLGSENALTGVLLQQRSRIELVIEGETYSPSSYRDAQEQVLAFAEALADSPRVEVQMRQMPIEIRTDTEVRTVINDSEVRSRFVLEVFIDQPRPGELLAEVGRP